MSVASEDAEILDLFDDEEQVIGTITRAEANELSNLRGYNLRCANAFIVNTAGKLWIPTRTAHKKIAPNGLDYSMGEHTMSGESNLAAAIRGFAEELNLSVAADDLLYIGTLNPSQDDVLPYFAAHYLYFSDTTPAYNHSDFAGYNWLSPDEVLATIAAGTPAKQDMPKSIGLVLRYMRQH